MFTAAIAIAMLSACDGGGGDGDEAEPDEREPTTETADEDQVDARALEDRFVDFLGIESAECPDEIEKVEGEQVECELSGLPGAPDEAVTATVTVSPRR